MWAGEWPQVEAAAARECLTTDMDRRPHELNKGFSNDNCGVCDCGSIKSGTMVPCKECGFYPLSSGETFVYSIILSDHYFRPEVLKEISTSMLAGKPMPRLSTEQENEARRQYLPHYEKMKAMLPMASLIGKKEEITKKRSSWFRIFGR